MIIPNNYDSFPYFVEPKTALFAVNSLVSWQTLMLDRRFLVQAFITFVGIDNDKIWTVTSQNLDWIDNFDKIAVNFFQATFSGAVDFLVSWDASELESYKLVQY